MPLDYHSLIASSVEDQPVSYDDRDVMLYALGVGFGSTRNAKELPYVVETPALKTVPTFSSMLPPGNFLKDSGWNTRHVLLAGLRLELYRPLPAAADLRVNRRVIGAYDKGYAHGLIVVVQSEVRLAKDDTALFTLDSTLIARADGGTGGPRGTPTERHALLPGRDPDLSCTTATRADQALLFRLSGDRNPLHTDPAAAREAGFPRPLLHGRCTYGIACRAILETICDYDHTLITGFDARFSAPVYPGDTLTTDMWQDRNIVSFRCSVKSRNSVVLSHGKCTLAA